RGVYICTKCENRPLERDGFDNKFISQKLDEVLFSIQHYSSFYKYSYSVSSEEFWQMNLQAPLHRLRIIPSSFVLSSFSQQLLLILYKNVLDFRVNDHQVRHFGHHLSHVATR